MRLSSGMQDEIAERIRSAMMERATRDHHEQYEPEDSLYADSQEKWKIELAMQMVIQPSLPEHRIIMTTDGYMAMTKGFLTAMAERMVTPVMWLFAYWGAAMPVFVNSYSFAAGLAGLREDGVGAGMVVGIVNGMDADERDMLNEMAVMDAVSYYVSYIPDSLRTIDDFIAFVNDDKGYDSYHTAQVEAETLFNPLLPVLPEDKQGLDK